MITLQFVRLATVLLLYSYCVFLDFILSVFELPKICWENVSKPDVAKKMVLCILILKLWTGAFAKSLSGTTV